MVDKIGRGAVQTPPVPREPAHQVEDKTGRGSERLVAGGRSLAIGRGSAETVAAPRSPGEVRQKRVAQGRVTIGSANAGSFTNQPTGKAGDGRAGWRAWIGRLVTRLQNTGTQVVQRFFTERSGRAADSTHRQPQPATARPSRTAGRPDGPASPDFRYKPDAGARNPASVRGHSPDPVPPGTAFYREKQGTGTGLCGMHAINAFCGGPVIGEDEFKTSVYRNTAKALEMSAEEYRNLVAGEPFDSGPPAVQSALVELAGKSRIDPKCANVQLVSPLGIPSDSNSPAYRDLVDRINAFPGDRLILGYSTQGDSGHFVALRRDTAGNWQNVNSLDVGQRPRPIENLGSFIAGKTGVHLLHMEPGFSFDPNQPLAQTPFVPANKDPALSDNSFLAFASIARSGIDAARANVGKLLHNDVDMETARRTLLSGDGGMRRGTTALATVAQGFLKPAELPAHALRGTPEQWSEQTERLSQLARRIANAGFNEDLKDNFNQYGNTGRNPFMTMANELPDRDRDVRAWLAAGLDLASDLIAGQERAGEGLAPMTGSELDELERRVDAFCNTEARNERLPEFDADLSDAAAEIDRIFEAGRTVDNG